MNAIEPKKPGFFLLGVLLALVWVFGVTLAIAQTKDTPPAPAEGAAVAEVFLQSLTEAERVWLREHPVIRVAQIPDWPPIEFIDERGSPAGMAADYLTLMEQRLGLKFERVPNLSWQEAFPRLKRWEIDMTPSAAETSERKDFWAFTKPYMTIPIAVVTRTDVTYIADLRELAGKPVAVVDDFAITAWITRDFPTIQLIRVKSTQQGLAMLQRKEVFAFVDNMLVVGHYMAEQKMTDIKIAGSTPYNNAQCMAVRKDWAPLAGILDKALDSVAEAERSVIYRRWLPLRYDYGFAYLRLWPVAAILAAVLLGLVAWNWRLAREIKDRKQAEEALRVSSEKFRVVQELSPDGFTILRPVRDAKGGVVDFTWVFQNAVVARMNGTDPEAVIGRRLLELFPGHRGTQFLSVYQRVAETQESCVFEDCYQGETITNPIWFRIAVVPTCGDIAILAQNITESKQAEAALQASEDRLRFALDEIEAGAWDLDLIDHSSHRSLKHDQIFGYETLLPQWTYEMFLEHVLSEDRAQVNQDFRQAVDSKGDWHFECRIIRRDGQQRWIMASGRHRNDPSGQSHKMAGIVQDITERKQQELELRQKAESLRARNTELKQFNRAMVGRELRMIELKREINELCGRLGEPPRHKTEQLSSDRVPGDGTAPLDGGGA